MMKELIITTLASVCAFAAFADSHEGVQLWEGGPYWATTNIGAEEPWDYGYYFWWGDTVGYKRVNDAWVASDGSSSNFSFDNVPTYGKTISNLRDQGWIGADCNLTIQHDAAQAHWGESWRMPTYEEQSALVSSCYWTWTTTNGVNGYIVRGKGNYASKSIFLPAAGYGSKVSFKTAVPSSGYWSTFPVSSTTGCARGITFSQGEYTAGKSNNGRSNGFSVRPVRRLAVVTPSILDDSEATVTGDAESGYTVVPSVTTGTVELSMPDGIDAAKVTVEVAPTVRQVVPHGAEIRVVKDGYDITPYLDIPESGGTQFVASATVKESIVKEVLDEASGAEIDLKPSAPSIKTAPTRLGLTYTFSEGTVLEVLTQKAQKQGDGNPWTLPVTVKGGVSGFYSIGVGK